MNKMISANTAATTAFSYNSKMKCLLGELESLIEKIAEKFSLYHRGKPRKAFILDVLLRYGCTGCLLKALTQHEIGLIDNIYIENHRLALNLLCDHLKNRLNTYGIKALIEKETSGNYGRVDVILKLTSRGLQLNLSGIHVIIEVKCGKSLRYSQLFRYFIMNKNTAIMIVWRVPLRQVFILEKTKIGPLLLFATEAAVKRAQAILSGNITLCGHKLSSTIKVIENPQELINSVIEGLNDLPKVVDAIAQSIRILLKRNMVNDQNSLGDVNV